jgi:hypothetical protein
MQKPKIPALLAFLPLMLISCRHTTEHSVKPGMINYLQDNIYLRDTTNSLIYPDAYGIKVTSTIDSISPDVYHLKVSFTSDGTQFLRDIEIPLQFLPGDSAGMDEVRHSFHWVPNLKKKPEDIIAQHVFRSPAIILTSGRSAVSVIPDLDEIKLHPETPYYLDLNFSQNRIIVSYGLSKYKVDRHVYYERRDSSFRLPDNLVLGLYIISSENSSPPSILRQTDSLIWNTFGAGYMKYLLPQVIPFHRYAAEGYKMGLSKYWIDGPKPGTGGIALSTFLDTTTGIYRGRDFKDDLWFHSWFNNARTAYGLYLWGGESGNENWVSKALAIMNLLLKSPQKNGFFPTIWVPEKKKWISSGQGGGPDLYHVPDNCWTAIWLLRFNDELKKLRSADKFLTDFTSGLLKTQLDNGSFPARVRTSDLAPDPVLKNSTSGAMAAWFLGEMILRKKLPEDVEQEATSAMKRSLSFLETKVEELKFQDFEVFFSCAPNAINDFDTLTWLYPQNTLSIQWCAEAFLKGYQIFRDNHYLERGEYCLNLLSLYQQVWSPPFIDFYSFGGFGAQNTDAEWSDARQAQFAETYLNYFLITRDQEYLQRGIAACRASFALMAIPENKSISPQNYQGSSFNGEFTGAMAENFGHSGYNKRSGQSGFHWGTGSALTTAAIFKARLGDIYLDKGSPEGTGIDGIVVRKTEWGDTILLTTSRVPDLKQLKVFSDDGDIIGRKVSIDGDPPVSVSVAGKSDW